jgi:hypothetical protein
MVAAHLQEAGGDPDFSVRTLGRTLDRWGFTFGQGTRWFCRKFCSGGHEGVGALI